MATQETGSGGTVATPLGLVSKLSEIMAAVKHVPKRGRNEFHKYDYAMEADIVAAIRNEMSKRHVMLFPQIIGNTREKIGDKGEILTEVTMRFTFVDGDSGESIACDWMGAGSDKADKGVYKAMTGGEKYFLLKTFLIPTGDDPEKHEKERQSRQRASEPQSNDPNDTRPITEMQIKRLSNLIRTHNTNVDELKTWVDRRFGYRTTQEIQRRHYAVVEAYIIEGVDRTVEANA